VPLLFSAGHSTPEGSFHQCYADVFSCSSLEARIIKWPQGSNFIPIYLAKQADPQAKVRYVREGKGRQATLLDQSSNTNVSAVALFQVFQEPQEAAEHVRTLGLLTPNRELPLLLCDTQAPRNYRLCAHLEVWFLGQATMSAG